MAIFSKENFEAIKQEASGLISSVKPNSISNNCPNCNAPIKPGAKFCVNCGYDLSQMQNDTNSQNKSGKKQTMFDAPYIHDLDRKALQALEAIPGFATITKKFISVFNEKQFKILNVSSNLRLGPKQMPEIYNMLPPICEKLGIDVPELYLELDVQPNAYTYGDTKPFIVITSGLFETVPMELIPTVLAHECGHIACHHTLYKTIGRFLLNGTGMASGYFGMKGIVGVPLQAAYSYWERCSEFSADRAAALYTGGPDQIIDMCMRFSGYDKDLNLTASRDEFIKQAIDYQSMIASSKWDKTLEFLILMDQSHPFNAVRAKECYDWTHTEQFKNMISE